MKKIFVESVSLLLIIVCMSFNHVHGQDVIFKNDKTKLNAKVLEIEELKVKYKLFDNLDGPTYGIDKNQISMIIYKNGKKELFNHEVVESKTTIDNLESAMEGTNIYATSNDSSEKTLNSKSIDTVDFNYSPIRVIFNLPSGFNFSLSIMREDPGSEKLRNKAANQDAKITNYLNVGIGGTFSYYSDEFSRLSVSDLVLYVSWYFPLNKLSGSKNINTGFFPNIYAGGVLRSTNTIIEFSNVNVTDWTGDFALGIGLDYKFSRRFGLSVRYDYDYKFGAGINFNFK